eukprot:5962668-Lingulodinium_polyedra.AAC.1
MAPPQLVASGAPAGFGRRPVVSDGVIPVATDVASPGAAVGGVSLCGDRPRPLSATRCVALRLSGRGELSS